MSSHPTQDLTGLAPASQIPVIGLGRQGLAGAPQLDSRIVRLFGLDLYDTTRGQAARWIVERAAFGQATGVGFINAHCVNVMAHDAAYRAALQQTERLFADGSGLMIAAATAGLKLRDNLNGTDLFPLICAEAARKGVGIYLFGSQVGVASEAGQRMVMRFPGLQIAGCHHGYVGSSEEEDRLIQSINSSGARIVLVGLGVPKQELWIAHNRQRLTAPVVIGVGGLFDYYSGRIPRAPLALRRLGLEWLWRMAMEPRRLARRYLVGNVEFMLRLGWRWLKHPHQFDQKRTA